MSAKTAPRLQSSPHHPSSSGAEPLYIAIARIFKPQGRRGEVSAQVLTDFPGRFKNLRRVFVKGASMRELAVESAWPHKGQIVLKLSGVNSITEAERLRGCWVMIPSEERIPLADHSYYWFELSGCSVLAGPPGARKEVGTVKYIEPTAGAPLLHVASEKSDILIPFAADICTQIDVRSKIIIIDPPEDLLTLND